MIDFHEKKKPHDDNHRPGTGPFGSGSSRHLLTSSDSEEEEAADLPDGSKAKAAAAAAVRAKLG